MQAFAWSLAVGAILDWLSHIGLLRACMHRLPPVIASGKHSTVEATNVDTHACEQSEDIHDQQPHLLERERRALTIDGSNQTPYHQEGRSNIGTCTTAVAAPEQDPAHVLCAYG